MRKIFGAILRTWLVIYSVIFAIAVIALYLLFLWVGSLFLFVVCSTFLGSDFLGVIGVIVFFVCVVSSSLLDSMHRPLRGPEMKKGWW